MYASSAKRDRKIDLYRGIAAVGVIAIHTAFWSGEGYVPEWFQSLTLLIDVPFFFFIAGKSAGFYEGQLLKTGRNLCKMWLKWIYAVSVLAILCLIFKGEGITDLRDLFRNYCFQVSLPSLPVVGGSIWFMPYYIIITLINQIVLAYLANQSERREDAKNWYCRLLLFAFFWVATGHDFLGVNQYYLFYSFYWMLGMISSRIHILDLKKFLAMICLLVAGWFFSGYLVEIPYYQLQQAKFPPNLPYLFASLLMVVFTIYAGEYIKAPCRCMAHIGKNAFFYYIAQGVGSSLIYQILPIIDVQAWFMKWTAAFLANMFITVGMAEFFAGTYNFISACLSKIMKNIRRR